MKYENEARFEQYDDEELWQFIKGSVLGAIHNSVSEQISSNAATEVFTDGSIADDSEGDERFAHVLVVQNRLPEMLPLHPSAGQLIAQFTGMLAVVDRDEGVLVDEPLRLAGALSASAENTFDFDLSHSREPSRDDLLSIVDLLAAPPDTELDSSVKLALSLNRLDALAALFPETAADEDSARKKTILEKVHALCEDAWEYIGYEAQKGESGAWKKLERYFGSADRRYLMQVDGLQIGEPHELGVVFVDTKYDQTLRLEYHDQTLQDETDSQEVSHIRTLHQLLQQSKLKPIARIEFENGTDDSSYDFK